VKLRKTKIIVATCAVVITLSLATTAQAAIMSVLVGTSGGDDNITAVNTLITNNPNSIPGLFAVTDLDLKIDTPAMAGLGMSGANYSIDSVGAMGTWKTDGAPVHYYSIKGGNNFALYFSVAGLTSDMWDTSVIPNGGGKSPALSHISFWKPVPEPSIVALFALGLLGLGLSRRGKRN